MNQTLTGIFLITIVSMTNASDRSGPVGLVPTIEDADNVVRAPSYSPYAGRNFPTQVFSGDTHTENSLDPEVPMFLQERAYTSPIWYTQQ